MNSSVVFRVVLSITVLALCTVIVSAIILVIRQKSKPKLKNPTNNHDYWLLFYHGLSTHPFTKSKTWKIRKQIEIIAPSDLRTVCRKTSKYTIITLGSSVLVLFFLLLIGDLNLYYVILSCYIVHIVSNQTVAMLLEREENKLLRQLNDLLAEIRHHYHAHKMVDEAVGDSIEKVPYEISVHASIIYEVLTSSNMEEAIVKYNEISPNKFLMTLLAICQTTIRFGDKTVNHNSMFLQNLNYLKQEINIEILKRERLNSLFSGLILTTVLPVFAIKPLEKWCVENIPELVDYFDGKGGVISTVILFFVTMLVYHTLQYLKSNEEIQKTEHPYLDRLIRISWINVCLNKEIARSYSKHQRMDDLLKKIGESLNPKQLLLKRVLFFLLGVVVTLFVSMNILLQTRNQCLTRFNYDSSMIEKEETKELMRTISMEYMKQYKSTTMTKEQMIAILQTDGRIKSLLLKELVAEEIVEHCMKYQSLYFKWYSLIFALLAGLIAYQVPYLILLFRQKIQQMSMEDEVMQYQSIILMLMYIDRMDVYTILEWLERFATIFRTSLNDCINSYEKDGELALEELKLKEPFMPFTRLVDNLISCEKIGIVVSFDEIVVERSYYQEKRKQDNEIMLRNKGALGRFIGFIPFVLVIVLCLVLPFLLEAMQQFASISSELGGI